MTMTAYDPGRSKAKTSRLREFAGCRLGVPAHRLLDEAEVSNVRGQSTRAGAYSSFTRYANIRCIVSAMFYSAANCLYFSFSFAAPASPL